MFETIIDDPILIYKDGKEIEVPYPSALLTASDIWSMAEWIYSEFKQDCKTPLFDGQGIPLSMKRFKGFTFRNRSRTISYVIHIYNIELILEQVFQDLKALYSEYGVHVEKEIKPEKKKRDSEFKKIENFRHKVVAHSSWAYRKSDKDSNADREASLACWSGSFGIRARNPRNFLVGSCHQIIDGEEAKQSDYTIGIYGERQKMKLHFQAWEKLLVKMMNKLEAELASNLRIKPVNP